MSDDLATILKSIRNTQANILTRLERIEQSQQVQETTELVVPGGWGYTSPTSPPSSRILIRRGYLWIYDEHWANWLYSASWQDFQPELPISAFSTAYYYRAVVPFKNMDYWDPYSGFDVWERAVDYETYEECAADFSQQFLFTLVDPDASGDPLFPLCSLVIRNNGTTGSTNEYLPVTLTDRNQSSFLNRDLRPWFSIARVD